MLVIEPGNVRHYRMDRKVTDRRGKALQSSADSRTCPAMMTELAKVEALPMPRFAAPGSYASSRCDPDAPDDLHAGDAGI